MPVEPGKNNLIITAHPDDETLWCGGLPIRYNDRKWTVICCTIPRADPVRAEKFLEACRILGVDGFVRPNIEPEYNGMVVFPYGSWGKDFDVVFTHNAGGEYGHPHHRQVHDFVVNGFKGRKVFFGYGQDAIHSEIVLDPQEYSQKLAALKCYDHQSPLDGQPKWKALLNRYFPNGGFHRESYC